MLAVARPIKYLFLVTSVRHSVCGLEEQSVDSLGCFLDPTESFTSLLSLSFPKPCYFSIGIIKLASFGHFCSDIPFFL